VSLVGVALKKDASARKCTWGRGGRQHGRDVGSQKGPGRKKSTTRKCIAQGTERGIDAQRTCCWDGPRWGSQ
jgi:hypothetical protein